MTDLIQEFRQSAADYGLDLPDDFVPDGTLQRFTTTGDKSNSNNSWAVLYPDTPAAGSFGCWKRQFSRTWCSKGNDELTEEERTAYKVKMDTIRRQREQEKERVQSECRTWCADAWAKAKNATNDNPYLKLKGVNAYGLKSFKDSLLVPVRDLAGTIHGLQFIQSDGSKKFKTGTNKTGNFFKIGNSKNNTIIICEGYATGASIHQATGHAVVVAFDCGNLLPVAKAIRSKFPAINIIIAADDDQATEGNPGLKLATEAVEAVGGLLAVPEFGMEGGAMKMTDFNDLHTLRGLPAVEACIEAAAIAQDGSATTTTPINRQVVAINIGDFLAREFPARTNLLGAWLPSQGLTMVYAYRGIGKTHFALGAAYAVASGGSYLGWQALAPVGVMYIDGEMPGPLMQERLSAIVNSNEKEPTAPFILLTPDLQPEGMPRIDTEEGQAAIESVLTDDIKLIVIDNISTLSSAKENDADGWAPVQEWALKQRAIGRSVLFVHHSGKGGAQRGTSRREDVLDTVIALRRPVDYQPDQGAVFEVHFEKARGLYGDDVKPIEATLRVDESGVMSWLTRTVEECTFDRVVELLNDGLSQKEIVTELGINKSNVSRHAKRAAAAGLVKAKPKRQKMKEIDAGNGWVEHVKDAEI